MAALEAVILYIQLTLGIANPTSADVQRASAQMPNRPAYAVTYATSTVSTTTQAVGGWDIDEGN